MKKTFLLCISCILIAVLCATIFVSCGKKQNDNSSNGGYTLNFNTVYALAEEAGYTGTLEDLVELFKGDNAYQLAVATGYAGTEEDWLNSLVGATGKDGKDGITPTIGNNGNWFVGNTDTGVRAEAKDGENGIGIAGIHKTGTEGLTDTYTITFTDGKTTTFTITNGKDGANGSAGQDGKSAYELAVENGYTGTLQEWLASLVGAPGTNGIDGTNGQNGKSAYEIAKDQGYTGTEEEWVASLVGAKGDTGEQGPQGPQGEPGKDAEVSISEDGYWVINGTKTNDKAQGEQGIQGETGAQGPQGEQGIQGPKGDTGAQGVGVTNAYIDASTHLILVLSDGTEIDAGYVGVGTQPTEPNNDNTFTVSFVDYDGTVLITESVEAGQSATAPNAPTHAGYIYYGWDHEYSQINQDLTVKAVYLQNSNLLNCISFYSVINNDGSATITCVVHGNVNFALIEGSLTWESNDLSYVSSIQEIATGLCEINKAADQNTIYFAYIKATNVTDSTKLFSVTFDASMQASYDITVTIDDIVDATYNDQESHYTETFALSME